MKAEHHPSIQFESLVTELLEEHLIQAMDKDDMKPDHMGLSMGDPPIMVGSGNSNRKWMMTSGTPTFRNPPYHLPRHDSSD